jgi:hypothetical protein
MYLEDELRPVGGPDEFVKTQLCVKATTKPTSVPFQSPSRMVQFVQTAAQVPALKKHLLAVLWSLLPLNLKLTTVRNKKRPQHFGQSTGLFGGPQEVILNPNPQAQDFWKNLQALKVRILLLIDKAHVSILSLKNFKLSRFANSSDDRMHKIPSLPRALSPPCHSTTFLSDDRQTDRHTHSLSHTLTVVPHTHTLPEASATMLWEGPPQGSSSTSNHLGSTFLTGAKHHGSSRSFEIILGSLVALP